MLPTKWKIFRALNFVHIATVTIWLITILYQNWTRLDDLVHDWSFVLFALLFPIILIANGLFNANLLEKFYPDQLPGVRFLTLHKVLYFIFLGVVGCCIYGSIFLYYELFSHEPYRERMNAEAVFYILLVTAATATGIPITYFQVSLRKTIRRNFNLSMDRFLDT